MTIKRILLIALSLATPLFIWYVSRNPNSLSLITEQFSNPKVIFAFLLSAILLVSAHIIRALKTKLLTDSIKRTSWRTHTRALFIGYLFNVLLPLRVGEFIRAFVLGKSTKMSATFMFGLVLLDRAIDGIILASITFLLLWQTNIFSSPLVKPLVVSAASTLLVVALLVLVLLTLIRLQQPWLLRTWHSFTSIFNDSLRDSLRFKMWSLMYGLERVLIRKRLFKYGLVSIIMWGIYLVAIAPLIIVFTRPTPPSLLAGASTVSYLGVSTPAGPAYVGSYEQYVQPYTNRQPNADAVRATLILVWLLQVLPAFLIGLVFVLRTRETFKRPAAAKSGTAIEDKLLRDVDVTHHLGSFLDAFFTNNTLSKVMHRFEVDSQSKLIHYFKGGSNAITALVYENGKHIVRKITPLQYKYKLESQYLWLKDKKHQEKIVNVIGDETGKHYYKVDLEYNADYIPFFEYIHSMPIEKSKRIISEVFSYLFDHVYKPDALARRPKDFVAYLENRCVDKIRQAAKVNDEIRSLVSHKELIINGEKYLNIHHVIKKIKSDKRLTDLLATYRKCSIHGDVTIDNILAHKEKHDFLLIDPTDNENEISGPVFDFGRMTQSLQFGYEFLCRDDSKASVSENCIEFEHSTSSHYAELSRHLKKLQKKFLTEEEYLAVLFHSAVLYSRMLTHRVQINPLNAAKFYAISVVAFNKFLKEAYAARTSA